MDLETETLTIAWEMGPRPGAVDAFCIYNEDRSVSHIADSFQDLACGLLGMMSTEKGSRTLYSLKLEERGLRISNKELDILGKIVQYHNELLKLKQSR